VEEAERCRAAGDDDPLAGLRSRHREERGRTEKGQAEVGDAAVAVIERHGEGPDRVASVRRRSLRGGLVSLCRRVRVRVRMRVRVSMRVPMAVGFRLRHGPGVRLACGGGRVGVGRSLVARELKDDRRAVRSVRVVVPVVGDVPDRRQDPAAHEGDELQRRGLASGTHRVESSRPSEAAVGSSGEEPPGPGRRSRPSVMAPIGRNHDNEVQILLTGPVPGAQYLPHLSS
jgi:hypothetical protein